MITNVIKKPDTYQILVDCFNDFWTGPTSLTEQENCIWVNVDFSEIRPGNVLRILNSKGEVKALQMINDSVIKVSVVLNKDAEGNLVLASEFLDLTLNFKENPSEYDEGDEDLLA